MAGAGKTTIAAALYERLRKAQSNIIFLDGDMLRGIFGDKSGYLLAERKKLAMSYARLCKALSDQGIDVICSTISLFNEVHDFNRKHIKKYHEIFIECEMQELIRRDQKGIYSNALKGEMENVVGVDLSYTMPKNCDLVIDNTVPDLLNEKVERIIESAMKKEDSEKGIC